MTGFDYETFQQAITRTARAEGYRENVLCSDAKLESCNIAQAV